MYDKKKPNEVDPDNQPTKAKAGANKNTEAQDRKQKDDRQNKSDARSAGQRN